MSPEPAPVSTAAFMMRTDARDGEIVVLCVGRLTSEHADTLKNTSAQGTARRRGLVLDLGAQRGWIAPARRDCGSVCFGEEGQLRISTCQLQRSIRDLFGITNRSFHVRGLRAHRNATCRKLRESRPEPRASADLLLGSHRIVEPTLSGDRLVRQPYASPLRVSLHRLYVRVEYASHTNGKGFR